MTIHLKTDKSLDITVITSHSNQLVKLASSLKQRKYRDELGLFAVEGVRLVEETLSSKWDTQFCLYTPEAAQDDRVTKILTGLAREKCRLFEVSRQIYVRITDTEQPQGIMAIVSKRHYGLADLSQTEQEPFITVLDCIQDPGNIGTIIRTADAAGCSGIILTSGCADLFSGKALRSGMGSVFHVPIVTGLTIEEVKTFFESNEIRATVTCLDTLNLHWDAILTGPLAIVFGNEGNGVSQEWQTSVNQKLRIPIYGTAESLNVGASAAVLLYEAARQRRIGL